jgi:hypothetical protein
MSIAIDLRQSDRGDYYSMERIAQYRQAIRQLLIDRSSAERASAPPRVVEIIPIQKLSLN